MSRRRRKGLLATLIPWLVLGIGLYFVITSPEQSSIFVSHVMSGLESTANYVKSLIGT